MTSRDNTKMAKVTGIGMKRPLLTRVWTAARAKCSDEGGCRVCGHGTVEAAHIIGRRHDGERPINFVGEWDQRRLLVWADRIVPLCPTCHRKYDALDLDVHHLLTPQEQAQALVDAGGTFPMLWRTMASENPRRAA